MTRSETTGSDGRPRYAFLSLGTAVILLSAAGGIIYGIPALQARRDRMQVPARQVLQVLPKGSGFGDRVFADGEGVRANFRLVNVQDASITIKSVRTSCSCMATLAEGGRPFPVTLGPKSHVDISISTTALAARGLDQVYSAVVEAESGGGTYESPITVQFHVAALESAAGVEA